MFDKLLRRFGLAGPSAPEPPFDPREALAELLRCHGIPVELQGDVVEAAGGDLQLAVFCAPHPLRPNQLVQMDFLIRSPRLGDATLVESFAGMGDSLEACRKQAFGKFMLADFHLLLEALTDHVCDDATAQPTPWRGPGSSWTARLGPMLTLGAVDAPGSVPLMDEFGAFVESLEELFERTESREPAWIRVFGSFHGGAIQTFEVLLRNEPWAEAENLGRSRAWPKCDAFLMLRSFLILLPDAPPAL